MNKLRRLLSIALVAVLFLSFAPVNALAENLPEGNEAYLYEYGIEAVIGQQDEEAGIGDAGGEPSDEEPYEEPGEKPYEEPGEKPYEEAYDEYEANDENLLIASMSVQAGHTLDLSTPPTNGEGGVWEVTSNSITYTGIGPLTIEASNEGNRIEIRIVNATQIYIEDDTIIYVNYGMGEGLRVPANSTVHGLGDNITINGTTSTDGGITFLGSFGSIGSFTGITNLDMAISARGSININGQITASSRIFSENGNIYINSPATVSSGGIHTETGNIFINSPATVSGGISAAWGSININSPVTVSCALRALWQVPVIGIPGYTAKWSNNEDGSNPTSGSTYVWSPEHRWVSIDVVDRVYSISVTPGNHEFPERALPNYIAPPAETWTVSNNGNLPTGTLTVTNSNTAAFTVSTTSLASILAGTTERTFSVGPNTGLTEGTHTATITVSGGNDISESFDVSFTVIEAPPALTVSQASWAASVDGGSTNIDVTSNISWEAISDSTSWLTVMPAYGSNDGSIIINAIANTGLTSRSGIITITGSEITRTIAVTQAGLGHELDLSAPPSHGEDGVWSVSDDLIQYSGTGPLTIMGSNDIPLHIQVDREIHIYIENGTTISGCVNPSLNPNFALTLLRNSTLHGRGSDIYIVGGILSLGNLTLSGEFGGIFGDIVNSGDAIRANSGNVTISGSINSIISEESFGIQALTLTVSDSGVIGSIKAGSTGLSATRGLVINGSVGDITTKGSGLFAGSGIIYNTGGITINGSVGNISQIAGSSEPTGNGIVARGSMTLGAAVVTIRGSVGNITNFRNGINGDSVIISGSVGNIIGGGETVHASSGFGSSGIRTDSLRGAQSIILTETGIVGDISDVDVGIHAAGLVDFITISGKVGDITAEAGGIQTGTLNFFPFSTTLQGGRILIDGKVGDISAERGIGISANRCIEIDGEIGSITASRSGIQTHPPSADYGSITINGTVGAISGATTGISSTCSTTINGTVGKITVGLFGISVPPGNPGNNININAQMFVVSDNQAFSRQPTIGIPDYTATWSIFTDGSSPQSGSAYVWTSEHRWVRIGALGDWLTTNPPAQPTVSGTPTVDSISVNSIDTPGGWTTQYRIRTAPAGTWGAWQSSNTFTGLTADTNYQVQARFTAVDTTTHTHSAESTVSDNIRTATPTFGIALSISDTHTFVAATIPYGAQTPLTVTVENTGNQATGNLTVALSNLSPVGVNAFTLSTSTISSIAASGNATFTVTPNTDLVAGTYTATVTVSGGSNIVSQSFTVSFTVNHATTNQPAQPAVSDTPTVDSITVAAISAPNGWTTQYRIRTAPTGSWSEWQSGNTFTGLIGDTDYQVQARFTANNTATHAHSAESQISAYIRTAVPPPTFGIGLSTGGTHTFVAATIPYGAQPPLTVRVDNTGNQPTGNLTVALSNASPADVNAFTLSANSISSIAANGSTTFTVTPNIGLAVGTYTATVTVDGGLNITPQSFIVSFTVISAPPPPPPPPPPPQPPATPTTWRSGWVRHGSNWFFGTNRGVWASGWRQVGGVWYHFRTDGVMQTGLQVIGGQRFFFSSGGAMQTGWRRVGNVWYFFQPSGQAARGWRQIDGIWYHFRTDGVMQTGLQTIGARTFLFSSGGAMQTGWRRHGGNWFFFQPSGAAATGWRQIDNVWYFFQPSGIMVTGQHEIGGAWHLFSSSGAWQRQMAGVR